RTTPSPSCQSSIAPLSSPPSTGKASVIESAPTPPPPIPAGKPPAKSRAAARLNGPRGVSSMSDITGEDRARVAPGPIPTIPGMQATAAVPSAARPVASDGATDSVTGLARHGRVRAFDLARGLAVVFMIGVHVLWHWGAPDTWTSPIGQVISFLGGPTAAPVFMFLMGASLAFSSRSSFSSLAVRGLWLVWLGYLLNFLRGVIPAYLGLSTGLVTADQIAPFTLPWLALAAAVVLTGPVIRGLEFGTPLLDGPLTPVLGGAPNVYYAVVPWIAFPLVGAVFGAIAARATAPDARQRVFRWGALLGGALCAAGVALFLVSPPSFDVGTYWRMPPSYFVAITGLVLVWLWLCDVVVRHVPANRAFTFLYGWSASVIAIYFTHWLVVGWGVGIFGFRSQPLAGALLGIAVAIAATAVLSRFAIGLETPRWLERLASRRGTTAAGPATAPARPG